MLVSLLKANPMAHQADADKPVCPLRAGRNQVQRAAHLPRTHDVTRIDAGLYLVQRCALGAPPMARWAAG